MRGRGWGGGLEGWVGEGGASGWWVRRWRDSSLSGTNGPFILGDNLTFSAHGRRMELWTRGIKGAEPSVTPTGLIAVVGELDLHRLFLSTTFSCVFSSSCLAIGTF